MISGLSGSCLTVEVKHMMIQVILDRTGTKAINENNLKIQLLFLGHVLAVRDFENSV